jgi:hypothetical protein
VPIVITPSAQAGNTGQDDRAEKAADEAAQRATEREEDARQQ